MPDSLAPGGAKRLLAHAAALAYVVALGIALFASGAAALVNQVVWQRSLGRLLGGSETIASMTVVLVFMAGLGIGSIWMGRHCRGMKDPLLILGRIEYCLAIVNLLILGLLRLDLSHTVFAVQNAAAASGVPLLVFYAAGSTVVLMVPCLLMGATMPLAAEVCQRRFGWKDSRVLGMLMFLNTLGSVAGAVFAGGYLLPRLGQTYSLILAVVANAAAGLTLLAFAGFAALRVQGSGVRGQDSETTDSEGVLNLEPRNQKLIHRPRLSTEGILALGFGFCSLGYEMFLLRLFALKHQPLPFTFSAVITGFLLFWSLGAALSSRSHISLTTGIRLTAFAIVFTLLCSRFDRPDPISDMATLSWFIATRCFYFLPALGFGYLFAAVTAAAAKSWGRDVGRVYAWNTVGSCLGIVLMTVVGYEMPYFMMAFALVPLLFALEEFCKVRGQGSGVRGQGSGVRGQGSGLTGREKNLNPETRTQQPLGHARPLLALAACGAVVAAGLGLDMSFLTPNMKVYYGRDGVIAVNQTQRHMFWDGLWHSRLTDGNSHIGTYNWFLATCPVMAHPTGEIEDGCIIGLGLGITAGTLAKLETVKTVDAYEFNQTLKDVYRNYPDGTLGLRDNPKINIIWEDARSGMSLREKKYDVIQTQPLYLKQAGSSLLNSVEFFRLVSSRLKPGGIFCLYSNGTPEQAFAIRQTAAQVFRGKETFLGGYLLVLSNEPIQFDEAELTRRLGANDPLWREIAACEMTHDAAAILEVLDRPALSWGDGRLIISDDRPIVEYPTFLQSEIRRIGYDVHLPKPGFHNLSGSGRNGSNQ